jgi:hypothetical protein
MATLSEPVGATYAPFLAHGRHVACAYNTISMVAGDLDLSDTVTALTLPAGARVLDVILTGTDMDTGTGTLTFSVGDSGDAARFISGVAAGSAFTGRAGNNATSAAKFAAHTGYTADTDIIITTAAATNTAASGTLAISVLYVCE